MRRLYIRSLQVFAILFKDKVKSGYEYRDRVQERWYVRVRFYIRIVRIKKEEGHLVDALAIRGEEGRGTLRKVTGR